MRNEMEISFDAVSDNEGFARVAVAAFITHLNPTVEEMADIKTAVSEAVTNSIIHGYENYESLCRYVDEESGESVNCGGSAVPGKSGSCEEGGTRGRKNPGKVHIHCMLEDTVLYIEVTDTGKGIEDVKKAMEPLFTTKPELDRSGMGFAFMEAFMDELEVESSPGQGTRVRMAKKLGV